MLDQLRTFREVKCSTNEALKQSAVDYLRSPSCVCVVVEEISVFHKVSEFVDVCLGQNFPRCTNPLLANITEQSKKCTGWKVFWIGHSEECLKAGPDSGCHLALILSTGA